MSSYPQTGVSSRTASSASPCADLVPGSKITVPFDWNETAEGAPARAKASSSSGLVGLRLRRCPRLRLRKNATEE